ncbi:MAG: hypothetical protein L0Y72_15140 [Gemmataceae bacterium]|nr:hypothetical protein [Gemmataceae bacterium]MCI0740379.1 hypothetical protein [Gemmataceae bacterium]
MTQHQADILLWLLGGHLLLMFVLGWRLNDWLRAIHSRLDRIPKQDKQPQS